MHSCLKYLLAISWFFLSINSFALRIVLTNDDGFNSTGIQALKSALTAAGHTVTIIAPSGDSSFASASVKFGELFSSATINSSTFSISRLTEDQTSIDPVPASPVEALTVGTELLSNAPDLVISGINNGQNAGSSTNISGTVGACTVTASKGNVFGPLPCIAVSMEGSLFSDRITPSDQPYDDAADYIVRLIDILKKGKYKNKLLKEGTYLNVNYPALPLDDVKGVREVLQGDSTLFREDAFVIPPGQNFSAGIYSTRGIAVPNPNLANTFFLAAKPVTPPDAQGKDTDTRKLLDGYITVVISTGDNSYQCTRDDHDLNVGEFSSIVSDMQKSRVTK